MQNQVKEYILYHPDRGIEEQFYNVSDNRDPLDYLTKISDDVCAFRFFNPQEGYSPLYLVGQRISPKQVSNIAQYAFGIAKDCQSVIITPNGCYFSPDFVLDSMTIDEYRKSLDHSKKKNKEFSFVKTNRK